MPKKFTDLAELTALAPEDILAVVDSSASTSKKITLATLRAYLSPAGVISPYGGDTAPTGYLLCDGSPVSRSTYSALYAAIGIKFGAGDGTTTFNVPNLKGKVPVGLDTADSSFDVIGETGGAKTHTLTIAEMPNHFHQEFSNNLKFVGSGGQFTPPGGGTVNTGAGYNTNATGGGGAHNNLQPYVVTNYIIKT